MIILDASIAIKWFVVEEPRQAALELLDDIKKVPQNYAVPEFFFIEMMSVLTRLPGIAGQMNQIIDDLYNLGFIQIRVGSKLLKDAARFSLSHGLSGYDAIYAACAQTLSGTWVTADKKAHNKIHRAGISRLI